MADEDDLFDSLADLANREDIKELLKDNGDWQSLPIFMDELPEDPENDPRTASLVSIMNESDETPNDRAKRFKDSGNDCVLQYTKGAEAVKKKYENDVDEQGNRTIVLSKRPLQDAITYYTNAIELEPTDHNLLSILYSNRAHCSQLKGNHGKAYNDCRKAIEYDPKNIKAYYRGAQALLETGKAKNSVSMCDLGLKIEPDNSSLKKLRAQAATQLQVQQQRVQERYKREVEEAALDRALKKNNIRLDKQRALFDSMKQYEARTWYDRTLDKLHFPVIFLYDAHNQSDFIQDWEETVPLRDMLYNCLGPENPAPWDTNGEYSDIDKLNVYLDDAQSVEREMDGDQLPSRAYVKCDLDCTLQRILSNERVKIFRVCAFHVLVAGSLQERENVTSNLGHVAARIRAE